MNDVFGRVVQLARLSCTDDYRSFVQCDCLGNNTTCLC